MAAGSTYKRSECGCLLDNRLQNEEFSKWPTCASAPVPRGAIQSPCLGGAAGALSMFAAPSPCAQRATLNLGDCMHARCLAGSPVPGTFNTHVTTTRLPAGQPQYARCAAWMDQGTSAQAGACLRAVTCVYSLLEGCHKCVWPQPMKGVGWRSPSPSTAHG